jgi:hypothetical protein
LLAAVESPLLGADFLKHFKLLVNLSEHCLMDAETLRLIGDSGPGGGGGLLAVLQAMSPKLGALISQFPEVVNELGQLPPVKHAVQHGIVMIGCPVTARFQQLDAAKLVAQRVSFFSWKRRAL